MNESFPKYLYKYRSGSELDVSTLKNNKIFVPNFFNLNDIFESDFEFDLVYALDQTNLFYPFIMRNEFNEPVAIPMIMSRELCEEELELNRKNVEERIRFKRDEIFKKGVYSLSTVNNNVLMWGHYSDSNRGYCIEYEISNASQLDNSFYGPYPVEYKELPPKLPWFLIDEYPTQSILYHMVGIKSRDWQYEKEFRLIYPEGQKEFNLPFKIQSIIFGARAPDKLKKDIKLIFGDSVFYKKCVKGQNGYTFSIIETILKFKY